MKVVANGTPLELTDADVARSGLLQELGEDEAVALPFDEAAVQRWQALPQRPIAAPLEQLPQALQPVLLVADFLKDKATFSEHAGSAFMQLWQDQATERRARDPAAALLDQLSQPAAIALMGRVLRRTSSLYCVLDCTPKRHHGAVICAEAQRTLWLTFDGEELRRSARIAPKCNAATICNALHGAEDAHAVRFTHWEFGGSAALLVAEAVRTLTNLRYCHLHNAQIEWLHLPDLMQALRFLPQLEKAELCSNVHSEVQRGGRRGNTHSALRHAAYALTHLTQLCSLQLAHCCDAIGQGHARHRATDQQCSPQFLEQLDTCARHCKPTGGGGGGACARLTRLELLHCVLAPLPGAAHEALRADMWLPLCNATALARLDLCACAIGSDGAARLVNALPPALPSLTHLNLSSNRLQARDALVPLALLLERAPRLEHLDLSEQSLRHMHAAGLVAALAGATTLTQLALRNTCLQSVLRMRGAEAVSDVVRPLCALMHLDLSENGIDESGLLSLAKALPWLQHLTHVYLAGNDQRESTDAALARWSPELAAAAYAPGTGWLDEADTGSGELPDDWFDEEDYANFAIPYADSSTSDEELA